MAGLPFDVQGARAAGYTDDQIVSELQKSGKVPYDFNGALKAGHSSSDILSEVSPQPSGYIDNVKQGYGEALEGAGNTLNKAGLTNVGPALQKYGKSWEPSNFVPTPIFDDKGNFNGVGAIGKTLARSSPLAAASIMGGGLASTVGAPGLAVAGAAALPGILSSAGNEIDATGSVPRGIATSVAENAITATPVGRFLGGAAPVAGKVGAAGVAGALGRLGVTTAEQAAASGGGAAAGDLIRSGTVNPTDVANATVAGGAGGAAFAGARKTIPEVLNAAKYGSGGNDPLDAQARAQVANRMVANAGGNADALQGGLLPSPGAQRLGANAVNKTRADIQSELGTAVKGLQSSPDVDTQNALNAAQSGQHLTDAGYDLLTKGLGSDPQAANILNLIRQNEQLDQVGGHEVGGKLIGGLSSLPRHLLSGEHIAKSGLVGLMALAGEHAGHVIAFSPATLGVAGGAMLGGRLLDNMTGAQAPAGRFVRNFANGGDVRLPPPSQPVVQPPQQTAPLPVAGGSMMTPAAKAMQTLAQLAQKNTPAPAPTGTATPPVAGGRMITPNVQATMNAMATLQKAKQPAPAPAPTGTATPPMAGGSAIPPQVRAQMALRAKLAQSAAANVVQPPEPAPFVPRPVASGSAITPQVRASMDAMAKLAKYGKEAQAASAPAPTPEPAIDPLRLPTSITAPARSIMRGAATAQKLSEAQNPAQIKAATDLMAARRANAKLEDADDAVPNALSGLNTGKQANPVAATAPLPQAKGSIIPPGLRAVMNAQATAAKMNAPKQAAQKPAPQPAPAPAPAAPVMYPAGEALSKATAARAKANAEVMSPKQWAEFQGPLHREVPPFAEPQAAYKQGVRDYLAGKMDRTYPRGDLQASYDRGTQDAMSASRAKAAPAPAKEAAPSGDNNWLSATRAAVKAAPKPTKTAIAKLSPQARGEPAAPALGQSAIAQGIKAIAQRQGGISTVFIGDLAKEMGLPVDALKEVLPELGRRGEVNLHSSSTTRMSPQQKAGAITIGDRTLHTVTLGKPAAPEPTAISKLSPQARGAANSDDLSIPAFLQRAPMPKAVSKAEGKIETETKSPAGDEYTVPRSPYAHLPPDEAARKIYEDAAKNGKFLGDKEGFINGTIRNIASHRSRGAQLNGVPGVNGDEIAAQFEGIRNQAAAIRHREWLKKQYPQAAAALDEAFSDKYIKSGVWKKKGL